VVYYGTMFKYITRNRSCRFFFVKLCSLVALFSVLFSFTITGVSAHPGNTASDGCHYCRTNCDKWSVAWNVRHCHGGYVAPAPTKVPVVYTPTPATTRTAQPSTKSSSPQQNLQNNKSATSNSDNTLGGLLATGIALAGGYYGLKWLGRKTTSKD
jgi:hypothetical protein